MIALWWCSYPVHLHLLLELRTFWTSRLKHHQLESLPILRRCGVSERLVLFGLPCVVPSRCGERTRFRRFKVLGFFVAPGVLNWCPVSWLKMAKVAFVTFCPFFQGAKVEISSGFGIVFQDGLNGLLAAANCPARFPTIEQATQLTVRCHPK